MAIARGQSGEQSSVSGFALSLISCKFSLSTFVALTLLATEILRSLCVLPPLPSATAFCRLQVLFDPRDKYGHLYVRGEFVVTKRKRRRLVAPLLVFADQTNKTKK